MYQEWFKEYENIKNKNKKEEEKEAIEYLTKFTEYTRKNSKKQYRFDSQYAKDLEKRVEMFETVLNLIQRQQKEIEELKRSDIKQSKIECLEIQLKAKDKIIITKDEMINAMASEIINNHQTIEYHHLDENYEFCNSDINEVKQHFIKKTEE